MSYYLIVFRARSETMKFASLLNSYRILAQIVSTPRQISVSCGISVKINSSGLSISKQILARRQFYTCAGIFLVGNDEYIKL